MSPEQHFISDRVLEQRALNLLLAYQRKRGQRLTLPIVAEKVVQTVCELDIVWDRIPEPPGQTFLAGLDPSTRTIVLNEARRQVFSETPGLQNTVLGHEGAHWELHADKGAILQIPLDGIASPLQHLFRHNSPKGNPQETQAHRFMGYLLLPYDILKEAIEGVDLLSWPNLYRIREQFDVTISALTIRLERLGLIHVPADGHLQRAPERSPGQQRLAL